MNRKVSVGMMITIIIIAITVTFSITILFAMRLFDSTVASVKEKESMYNKVAEVDRYVRSNDYYTIDENLLYDRLTAGYLLGTGDKYARYYNASAYMELLKIQDGTLMGIGVELGIDQTGYAKVTRVYDNSPAMEAGIAVGNYITAIDGTDVKTMAGAEAVQAKLRGEAGTTVSLVWLDSEAAEHTAELIHSGYTVSTVDHQLLDNGVGYIKIRQFDSSTPSELDYAVRSLSGSGVSGLVIDLRDNSGGVLDDALKCIDLLCPAGTLGYAEAKSGARTILATSDDETSVSLPIACLVNGGTASAAELFASCLRTLNGARLVGTATQGKGTIQSSPQRLSDGSAVVITVAKLICADGTSFDGVGLAVDIERALTADEQAVALDYTPLTDPQVQRAASTVVQLTGASTLSAVGGTEAAASSAAVSSEAAAPPEEAAGSGEEIDSAVDAESEADSDSKSESDASSEQAEASASSK